MPSPNPNPPPNPKERLEEWKRILKNMGETKRKLYESVTEETFMRIEKAPLDDLIGILPTLILTLTLTPHPKP